MTAPIVLKLAEGDTKVHLAPQQEFLLWLCSPPKREAIAVDTETTGLEWEADVRLVQFGDQNGGFAISVKEQVGRDLVIEALMKFEGRLIFHNASFDIRRLHQIGVDPDYLWPRADNTHVMSHVLDPSAPSHRLKDLGRTWLKSDAAEAEKLHKKLKKKHKWDWATEPRLVLAPYGIADTMLTHQLHEFCEQRLTTTEFDVCQREYEVAQAVAEVSYKGMQLDVEYALDLQATWGRQLTNYRIGFESMLAPVCGPKEKPNPNSVRQWSRMLIAQGWEPRQFTKTNEVQLDKVVLLGLADKYTVVRDLMEYKRLAKWKSAYVDNCLSEMDSDGRVHAGYNSLGARTGRMSCSNPPLQQLPKGGGGEVRRLFIASPGNLICSVDYAAIEMRLAGHFASDPTITAQYAAGIDVYQEMADAIGCTRPQAKIASLAALYGSKGKSIARALGVSPAAAVGIVTEFWSQYPALSRWAVSMTNKARSGNHVVSKWGRRLAPHRPYAAGNAVIQGTAAEVMKEGILRLAENGLLHYVVAIVHDEVVLDIPEAIAEATTQRVAEVLEDSSFSIPLLAEASVYGRSWGSGYSEAT